MRLISLILLWGSFFAVTTASAHCMKSRYYVGGGMAVNDLPQYDDAAGFQVFGGYCLNLRFENNRIKTSAELGYMDSGKFERTVDRFDEEHRRRSRSLTQVRRFRGVWSALLAEYKLDPKVHVIGRVGLDVGDDDGMMLGGGMAVNLSKWAQVRGEYVIRDQVDSLQVNVISEF